MVVLDRPEVEAPEDSARNNGRGPRLPIEPFRNLLEREVAKVARRVAVEGDRDAPRIAAQVADQFGISAKTLYRYRYEAEDVLEASVDRALSRDGRYHINDLYPHLAEVGL